MTTQKELTIAQLIVNDIPNKFKVDIPVPKVLKEATADVWYDFIGYFFIADIKTNEIICKVYIKDNKDYYKEFAIYLFDHAILLKKFLLLQPIGEYNSLYKIDELQPKIYEAAKLEDDDIYIIDELAIVTIFDTLKYSVPPTTTSFKIPEYLMYYDPFYFDIWGEIYFYDNIKMCFTNFFKAVSPQIKREWRLYSIKTLLSQQHMLPLSKIDDKLFFYENKKLIKII